MPERADYCGSDAPTSHGRVAWVRIAAIAGLLASIVAWGKANAAERYAYLGERELSGFLIAFAGVMLWIQLGAVASRPRRLLNGIATLITAGITLAFAIGAAIAIHNGR